MTILNNDVNTPKNAKPKRKRSKKGKKSRGASPKKTLDSPVKEIQDTVFNKDPFYKTYNFGERGSGFTIRGEPQDFYKLREECFQNGTLFEDSQFPANGYSLFNSVSENINIKWKRPPQLTKKPQFKIEGSTRFNSNQSDLSDCWLLSALATIITCKNVFHQVVPEDQNFTDKYAGIFHFRFWQFGRWIDVVVDDRLPTVNGKLRFLKSTEKNEFWTALLEKAYAKLNGSYNALETGSAVEALTDFTGGCTETITLTNNNCTNEIFALMLKAYERNSLMVCNAKSHPEIKEFANPVGIIHGHPYIITDVKNCKIDLPKASGNILLLRLRNQWNNKVEWNGPFSKNSSEWRYIPENKKRELGLVLESDGEFWMIFQHFCKYFDVLNICNLRPELFCMDLFSKHAREMWNVNTFEGEWVKGVTAGGSANCKNTFHINPQYCVTLMQPDDAEKKMCTMTVFVLQKYYKSSHLKLLPLGIALYAMSNPNRLPIPLDFEFFNSKPNLNAKNSYECLRQITYRFTLPPGTYCIVPSTFLANSEREFIIQVYTSKVCNMEEYDEILRMDEQNAEEFCCGDTMREIVEENIKEYFLELAGEDKEVDWMELKEVLDRTMEEELGADGFSKDICRSMIAMMDYDYSGKLGFDEFKILWPEIYKWKKIYKAFEEKDYLPGPKLREVLKTAGFIVNNHILNIIEHRYGNNQGNITFDDYIMCLVRLKTTFETFMFKDQNNMSIATFTLEEWLQKTVYS